jgi:hypothetical protein
MKSQSSGSFEFEFESGPEVRSVERVWLVQKETSGIERERVSESKEN